MIVNQVPNRKIPIKKDCRKASFNVDLINPLHNVVATHPSKPDVLRNSPCRVSETSRLKRIRWTYWKIYLYRKELVLKIQYKNQHHPDYYLATAWGWNKPADSDIKCVSSGLVLFSVANPGVSVSGGQFTVTFMLKGDSSNEKNIQINRSFISVNTTNYMLNNFLITICN